VAIAKVGLGDLDGAEALFLEVLSADSAVDDEMLSLNGRAGLAEVELARARAAEQLGDDEAARRHRAAGMAGYLTAVESSRASHRRLRPESLLALATLIVAESEVADSLSGGDQRAFREHGRELRIRLLVEFRRRSLQLDRPVLGTAAVALARWALDSRHEPELAAELMTLASGISPRQDSPSMRLAPQVARVCEAVGADSYGRMLDASGQLTRDERVARIREVLSSPALRG
jgi:hypothetical protein